MGKINARNKGNSYELKVIRELNSMYWPGAVSSRSESKRKDDAGIDICYTDPYNIQCKAVERLGNIHQVLNSMPKDENINLVFHKRNRQGEVVSMTKEDFYKIIKQIHEKQ